MTDKHKTSSLPQATASLGRRIVLGAMILVLLLLAVLGGLWINNTSTATETEDAERSAVRAKNLEELQAADQAALTTYGWNDQAKGVVHIPITKAMELALPAINAARATSPASAAATMSQQQ